MRRIGTAGGSQSALFGSKITDEKSGKVNVMAFGNKGRSDTRGILKNRGVNYISKPPALPGDSKSWTAPYFETLRNADKSADKRRFVRRGSASKSR